MSNEMKIKTLLCETKKIRDILSKENEVNWIRGVDLVIEKLEWSLSEKCNDPDCFFLDACDTWNSMMKGNGSFSDYYIWRDDFDERVYLNEKLDSALKVIWNIVSNS